MTPSLVSVEKVKKRYGDLEAVKGVSFEIQRGEIFGLLGSNGAGKTTTISMISGTLSPSEGQVTIAGEDVSRGSLSVKRAVGVTPQDLAIYPRLTGRENLEFFGTLYGLKSTKLSRRVDEMLVLVGLTESASRMAEEYSGGMKRRLNLAAGLMHSPQILLLDEPTVGVDPQSRNHIFEGVRELNGRGLTLLYTSHYMEEVQALCDRVGIMDGGELVACDTVKNLIAGMGGSVIEIGTDAPANTEPLLQKLRAISSVQEVEFIPIRGGEETEKSDKDVLFASGHSPMFGTLRLRAGQPNQILAAVINLLNRENAPIHHLDIKEPNLEDVFLKLTGKSLRD